MVEHEILNFSINNNDHFGDVINFQQKSTISVSSILLSSSGL